MKPDIQTGMPPPLPFANIQCIHQLIHTFVYPIRRTNTEYMHTRVYLHSYSCSHHPPTSPPTYARIIKLSMRTHTSTYTNTRPSTTVRFVHGSPHPLPCSLPSRCGHLMFVDVASHLCVFFGGEMSTRHVTDRSNSYTGWVRGERRVKA